MPKRKQWKLETMLTTMEDNVKAYDRESKRIVLSKPETRARQNALQRERRALMRQQALTMTILNTRNVFKLLLFTLPPVLVLSRILLIRPFLLLLPAPTAFWTILIPI
ncbi:hypothetical protein CDAR_215401 [Caerostris darwini]|uniref:Uncharacterized protein n=1 Tax=Caerostris darwini TaxID=1538125 RepID=A0AAV4U7D6_9ARAC|nr:hypothetical protein CDAR_215401 [Caerostris darwini]